MRQSESRFLIAALAAQIAATVGACSSSGDARRGAEDGPEVPATAAAPHRTAAQAAKLDIAAGRLALRTYGLQPAPEHLAELLRARLGVELVPSAGCALTPQALQEIEDYNAVMKAEIARRFGPDTLETLRAQASARAARQAAP
jgi:hypothetical protein